MQANASKEARVTLFERAYGPVGWQAAIVDPSNADEFVLGLLGSQLAWFWESAAHVAWPDFRWREPQQRSFTLLTPEHSQLLVEDLRETDPDCNGRYVGLVGVDAGAQTELSGEAALKASLLRYAEAEAAPVRLVLVRIGDCPEQYIFVPHDLPSQTQSVLLRWGLDAHRPLSRAPYRRLHSVALESVFNLPVRRP
jgi:hypothetical protein